MPFIGQQPPAVALTASDITDGIISTAKIADDAVTKPKLDDAIDAINYKNILINGDMQIAQRATSTASVTGNGYHTIDRMFLGCSSAGTWTQSQDTDVPTGQGFGKSLKMDNTTADASLGAGDNCILQQRVEGQMLQHLKKGTSSAESLMLSFWVKAVKTGTNIVELYDNANTRQISKSYTVDSTNTWEKKEITFTGDTSGTLANDNTSAMTVLFWLAAGSNFTSGTLSTTWTSATSANRGVGQVNHADSTSNNFWITGIQLEVGDTVSDFEFLPYDINLSRCQRYYHQIYSQSGTQAFSSTLDLANCQDYDGSQLFCMKDLPTTMRSIPSIVQTTGTDYLLALRNGAQDGFDGFNGTGTAGYNNIAIFTSGAENYSGSQAASVRVRCNASYKLAANAEL